MRAVQMAHPQAGPSPNRASVCAHHSEQLMPQHQRVQAMAKIESVELFGRGILDPAKADRLQVADEGLRTEEGSKRLAYLAHARAHGVELQHFPGWQGFPRRRVIEGDRIVGAKR